MDDYSECDQGEVIHDPVQDADGTLIHCSTRTIQSAEQFGKAVIVDCYSASKLLAVYEV